MAKETTAEKAKNLNDKLDLSKYNYKGRFDGPAFTSYIEMVEGKRDEETGAITEPGLNQTEMYDFSVFKAIALRKKAYPLLKDSPMILVGIELLSDTPVATRRTTLSRALTMNEQIEVTFDKRTPMEYYLLAKATM